jgi:transcriptional regulator with XRE-family HTH domain
VVKYIPRGNDDTTIKVKWRENEKEQANPKGGDVMFGEFVKGRRIARDVSLRKFCQTINWDASNWSKIERSMLAPPQEEEKLKKIANVLGIKVGTDEWQQMIDLARIGAKRLPDDISSDKRIMNSLPLFFRTVRSEKPTPDELDRLINLIKKGHE